MTTQANMDLRLLLLLVIVAATSAGPIASSQRRCATTCSENAKFHYEPGKTYEYLYTADTTSQMQGADSDLAGMHIRATAKVEVIAPCDMTLKLTDIMLEESDASARRRSESSDDLSRHLSARPLHFSYQDGRVAALCTEEEDPEWVLNIKRGVLSAFQNSMDHFNADHVVTEVDVAGRCEASYGISRGFTSTTITKSKDLLACTDRVDPMSAFKAMPYQSESKLQSLPVVKSTHTCEQSISSGLLARSECFETHVLRPFSNQDSGAVAETRHSLELQSQSTGVSSDRVGATRQTDLLFKHDNELETRQDASLAEATLRQACDSEDIRPETPALFTQLVSQFRTLDENTLRRLRKTVENERLCSGNHEVAKKYVRDALPMTGTSSSVSVMARAVTKGEVQGLDADAWMSSLAFVSEPKLSMVRSVHRLLSMDSPSRATMLASSSLLHAFCLSRDCESHGDVTAIAQLLANRLGQSCQYTTPEEREQILSVLKSLGNLGVSINVSSILVRCASNGALDAEVRVAALDAFRRMPCQADDRSHAMTVFEDTTEDSEVRIAAYVSAMRCPTEPRLRQVRRALGSEEVNQVGSFVWTHLTNLQETQDQFKSSLRAILGDARLQREFNLDARKFSRNYDASYFSPTFNTGAKVDGNLVWSQNSFVPRSANLNLTVDIFGNSVNLLEVGGRVEGAEALLESIFGPEGYFPDTAISDALTRAKRSVSDDPMEAIRSQFAGPSSSGPSGSMYLRMFGNELTHASVSGERLESLRDSFNPLEMMLTLAQGGSMDLGKHVQFVDTTLTLPTLLGMPLRLALNGTASVALQVGGKIDLRQVAANPREIDIDGYIKPSGAVELTSTMMLDATLVKTGLKLTTTLHTSTQANVLLKMQRGQVIQAKIDMPQEKIEIASLKSRVYLISGNQEREQQLITEGRVEKQICTGSQMETVAGLRLCASLAYPNATLQESAPWYPMTGPLTAEIAIEKVDDFSAYEFEASYVRDQERANGQLNRLSGHVGFNTPGSRVDREMLIDFNLDVAQKTVSAELRSPWKRASLNGVLVNQDDLKRATMTAIVDGTHEAAVDAQLHRQVLSHGVTYTPNVELRWPDKEPLTLEGVFTHKPSELTNAELTLSNVFQEPVVIKGTFSQELQGGMARIDNLFEVRTPFTDIKGSAFVEMKAGSTRGEADLRYMFGGQKERMSANMRLKRVNNQRTFRKFITCEVTSTQFPQYNVRMDADHKNIQGQADTSLDFRYGNDLETTKKRLTLTHTVTYSKDNDQFTMDHSARLSCKPLALAMDGKLNHMHNNNEVRTRGVMNYMQGQQANLDLSLTRSLDPIGLSADVTLSYPGRVLHITDLFETRGPQQYHHELMIQWAEDARITTTTDVGKIDNRYELQSDLHIPNLRPIILTAGITPNPLALDAMTSLQFEDNTYSGSIAYGYLHREQITWALDLLHPARHVTSQGDIHGSGDALQASMDIFWDADGDTSRKIAIDVSVHRPESGLSYQGKLQYPGRKITMAADHEQHGDQYTSNGQLSWARDQRVTVHHEMTLTQTGRNNLNLVSNWHVTTAFSGFENLEAQLQYNLQSSQASLESSFQWAEGQRIEVTLQHARPGGWMRVQNQLTLRTPFHDVQSMDARFNYNMLRDTPKINMDVDLNENKIIDIDASGKVAHSEGQLDLQIRTVVAMARNIRMTAEYTQGRNQHNSHAFINFNGQRFEATVEGSNTQMQLLLKNPYTNDLTISANHNVVDGQYTTTSSVQWAPDRQIVGSVQIALSKPSSHGEVTLTTPFQQIGQLKLEWNHAMENGNYQADTSFAINEQTYKMAVNHVNEPTSNGYSFTSDLNVESPWEVLSSGSVHTQSSLDGSNLAASFSISKNEEQWFGMDGGIKLDPTDINANVRVSVRGGAPIAASTVIQTATMPFRGHLEVSWDHSQRVAMDMELSYSGINEMRGMLQLETPVAGFERMLVELTHTMDNSAYTSHAELQYGNNKQIQMEATGRLDENRMSFSLNTPCPKLRRFALTVEQNNVAVEFESEDGRSNLLMSRNADGSTYNMRINSPYQYFENINADVISQVQNGDKSYGLMVDLSQTHRIDCTVRVAANGLPRYSAELTTPFALMRSMRVGFNHQGTFSVFNNEIDMNLVSDEMNIEVTSAFELNGVSSMTWTAKITGSWNAEMNIAHGFANHEMNSMFEVSFDGNRYGTALTMNRVPARGMLRLYTHHSEFEELTIELENSVGGTGTNYRNSYKLIAGGQTHVGEFTIGHNNLETMTFEIDMNSPLIPGGRAQASISNAIRPSGMQTQLSGMCASRTYTIESDVNTQDKHITITMTSPLPGYERLHLNAYYDTTPTEYHSNVQIQYPGSQISGDMRITTAPYKMVLSLASPFDAMRHLDLSLEHSGDVTNFHTIAELDYSQFQGKVMSEVAFNMQGTDIQADLKFNSPFSQAEQFNLHVENKLQGSSRYVTSLMGHYLNDYTLQLTSEMNLNSIGNFDSRVEISSTFGPLRSLALATTHTGSLSQGTSEYEITINHSEDFKVSTSWNLASPIDINTRIETPIMETLTFRLKHQGQIDDFTNTIEMSLGHQVTSVETSLRMNGGVEANLQIRTPILDNIDFHMHHQGDWINFQHSTELSYVENEQIQLSGSSSTTNGLTVAMTLNTPFSEIQHAEVSITHRGNMHSFESNVHITIDSLRMESLVAWSLQSNSAHGNVALKSSVLGYENFGFELQSTWESSYQSTITAKYGNNQMVVDGSWDMQSGLQTQLSIRGATFMDDATFSMQHTGEATEFENEIRIRYGNIEAISYTGSFTLRNNVVSGNFVINTELYGLETLGFRFNHAAGEEFTSETTMLYGADQITMSGSLAAHPNVDFDFMITGPTWLMPKLEFTLQCKPQMADFSLQSKLMLDNEEMYTIATTFTLEPIRGSLRLTSPYVVMHSLEVAFSHTASSSDIQDKLIIKHNSGQVFKFDSSINIPANEATFRVDTLGHTASVDVGYSGQIQNFRQYLNIDYDNQNIWSYSGVFGAGTSYNMDVEIRTGHTALQHLTIKGNHQGTNPNFQQELEVKINTESTLNYRSEFSFENNIHGSIHIGTTFAILSDAQLTFNHEGGYSNFNNDVNLHYNNEELVSYRGAFSATSDSVTLDVHMGGVYHPVSQFSVKTTCTGSMDELRASIELDLDDASLLHMTFNGPVVPSPNMAIEIHGSSSIFGIDNARITITHKTAGSKYDDQIQINMNDFRLLLSSTVDMGTSPSIAIEMASSSEQLLSFALSVDTKIETDQQELSLNYNDASVFTFKNTLDFQNGISVDMEITSFYEPISLVKISLDQQGKQAGFNNRMEIQVNNFQLALSSDIVFGSTTNVGVEMTTTLDQLRQLSVNMHLQMLAQECRIQYNRNSVFTFTNNIQMQDGIINVNIDMTSAYTPVAQVKIMFRHSGSSANFNDQFQIQVNDFELTFSSDIEVGHSNNIRAEITSTLEQLQQLSADMQLQLLNQEVNIRHNRIPVITFTNRIDSHNGISINMDMTSVYEQFSHMKIIFNHNGALMNFNDQMQMQLNDFRLSFSSSIDIERTPRIQIEVSSTGEQLSQLSVDMQLQSHQQELTVRYKDISVFTFSNNLNLRHGININSEIRSSYGPLSHIIMTFNHQGGPFDFGDDFKIVVNGEDFVHVTSAIELSLQYNIAMEVKTWYGEISQASISAKHTDGVHELGVKWNEESAFAYNIEFDTTDEYSIAVSVTSMCPSFSSLTVNASLRQTGTNFHANGAIRLNRENLVTVASTLENTNFQVSIQTMYRVLPQAAVKASYESNQMAFEIQYNREDIFTLRGNCNLENGFNLRTAVTSKYQPLSHLEVEVTHTGGILGYEGRIELNGEQLVSLSSGLDSTHMEVELRTAYAMVSQISVSAEYARGQHKFEIKYQDQALFTYTGTFHYNNGLDMQLVVTTKYEPISHVSLTVSHTGGVIHFSNAVTFSFNNEQMISVTSLFSGAQFEAELHSNCPIISQISVKTNYANGHHVFEIKYNDGIMFTYNGNYRFRDGFHVRIDVTTAYQPISQLTMSASHDGGLTNFNSENMIALNGQQLVSVTYTLDTSNEYRFETELVTRVEAVSQASFKINCASGRQVIEAKFNNDVLFTYSGDCDFSNGFQLEFTLDTQYEPLSQLTFMARHRGGIFNFDNEGSISLNGERVVAISNNVNINNEYHIESELRTAHSGLTHVSVFMRHGAQGPEFGMDFNGDTVFTISGTWDINDNGMHANFQLRTMFRAVSELQLIMNHNGNYLAFSNEASIHLNGDQLFSLGSEVDLRSVISVTVELRTSSPVVSQLSLAVKYSGDFTSNRQEFELKHNGNSLLNVNNNFSNQNGLSGEIHVSTASEVFSDIMLSYHHTGSLVSFTNNGFIQFNGNRVFTISSTIVMSNPLNINIDISTALEYLSQIALKIDHESGTTTQQSVEFSLNGLQLVQYTLGITLSNNVAIDLSMSTAHSSLSSLIVHVEHSGTLTNFNCNGNVELNGAKLITGTSAFSMASGISGHVAIDSVVNMLKDLDISISQNGNLQSFTVHGTVSQGGKDIELDVSHQGNPLKFTNTFEMSMTGERVFKMENNVDVQSRFYIESRLSTVSSEVLFKLEHAGSFSNFRANGELSLNGNTIISADADIVTIPLSGRISLDSMCSYLRNIQLSLNHNSGVNMEMNMDGRSLRITTHYDGTWDDFQHSLRIILDDEALVAYNGELKLWDPFKLHIQYESTCTIFQSFDILMEHNGLSGGFSDNLAIQFNNMNVISATFQLSTTNGISGSLSTNSDFANVDNIRIAVSHQGSIREFTSSVELRHNSASYDLSLQVDIRNLNDIQVTLRTPFEHAHELTLAVSHQSTSDGMTARVELSSGGTINGVFEYNVNFGSEMSGTIHVSGPFEIIRSVELTYNLHIGASGLRMGINFESDHSGAYSANAEFSMESGFSGSINVKTPFTYFTDSSFGFEFSAGASNMRSRMTMRMPDLVEADVEASLLYNSRIQGQLEVRTDLEAMRHLVMTLNHEGFLFNFNTAVVLNHNGQQIANVAINVQTTSEVVAQLAIESEFAELRNLLVKFTQRGEISDFNTEFVIEYNGNEVFHTAVTFKGRPSIEGAFVLTVPMSTFSNLEVRFSHEGSFLKFKTASSLTINHEQQGEANMEFDVTDGLVISLGISTPLSEPITLHMSHQGTISDFTTETLLQFSEQTCSVRAHFSQSPLNLDVQVSSPFSSARNIGLTLQHQGSPSDFSTAVNFVHNEDAYGSQVSFRASPVIDATLRLNTPFTAIQEASLRLHHQGSIDNFETGLTLSYGNGQTAEGRITFSIAPEFVARVEIQAPLVHASSGIRYTASGQERHFTLDANWNEMTCQLTGTVKSRPFEISVQLTTPFQHVQDLHFSTSMRRGRKSFHAEVELRHNHNQIIRFVSDLNNYAETSGTMTLQTPIPYVEHIGATFTIRSDDSGMQYEASLTIAPGKTIGGNVRLQKTPSPQLELRMNTPFTDYENINVEVSLHKNTNNVGIDVEMSLSTGNIYSMQMRLSQDPTLLGSLVVHTPFTEEFHHQFNGDISGSTLTLTTNTQYGASHGSLLFTLQATPNVEGHLQIETPFTGLERIEFGFTNEDLVSSFRKAITISLAPEITYGFAIESSYGQEKSFSINVKTPYAVMRDVVVTGTLQKSDAVLAYTFDITNEASTLLSHHLTLHIAPHHEISATLRTPISGMEFTSITAKLEKRASSVVAEGELTYNGGRKASLNYLLDYSGTSIHSTFDMVTPCSYLTDLGFSFRLDTASRTQSPQFVLRYQRSEVVSVSAEVALPTSLAVTLNTPVTGYETIRLTVNSNENGNRYEPSMVLSWGNQEVELTGALIKSGSRYNTQLEGTLQLRTPWSLLRDVRMQAGQTRGRGGLTTRLSSSYNQQSVIDMEIQTSQEGARRAANVAIRSPIEVSGRTSMDGNLQQFTADVEITVDGQAVSLEVSRNSHASGHSISTRLTTPTRTMQLASNLEWTATSWSHTADFTWDLAKGRTLRHRISLETSTSRALQHYSLNTRLDTTVRSFELSASTEKTSSALTTSTTVFWDAAGDRTRTISVTNRFERTPTSYVQEVTVSLPNLERDINLRNELGINSAGKVFSGRSEVQYSNDPSRHFSVSASLEDSTTDGLNYTLQFGLRHPVSQIDMHLLSNFADNPSSMAAGLEMDYLSAGARQRSNMRLRGEIQKLRNRINMEMSSPLKNFRVDGNFNDDNDHMSMHMVASTDASHQVSASLDLNSADRTLDMKAYLDPENVNSLVHVVGKYTPTSLALDAYHQDGESHVSDAEIDVEVRDKRIVYSKLFWRPQILADLKASLVAAAEEFKTSLVQALASTNDAIATEISSRGTLIPELPNVAALFEVDAQDISRDWNIISRELEIMYNSNEFYMQDIEQISMSVYTTVTTAFTEAAEHIMNHVRSTCAYFVDAMNTTKTLIKNALVELSRNCVDVCGELLRSYQAAVLQINARWQAAKLAAIERAVTFCHEVAVVAGPVVSDLYNRTATYVNVAYEYISSHPYVRDAATRLSQIDLWRPASDMHLSLSQHIQNVTEGMQRVADSIVETYVSTVRYFATTAVNQVHAFVIQPEVRYVLNFVKNTTEQVRTLYEGLQFQETSRQALEDFLTSVTTIVRTNAEHLLHDWLQLDEDRLINWAPAEGLIEFQVYIPMDLPQIQPINVEIPDFRRLYNVWFERLYNLIPSFDIAPMWDVYYQYKPSADVTNWVPPFKSFAVIGGRQHYMTFDRRHFDFSSPCSHVLAGDHVTGQWSLSTASTENDVNAHTLAFVAGDDRIEITPDYQVLVNAQIRELPIFLTSASVRRDGSMLHVETPSGVSLRCDVIHDVCRLEITGWQFGKTGGLLGTYNNEPVDDLTAPNGQRMTSLTDFTSSWALGGDCHSNAAAPVPGTPEPVCQGLFNNPRSPFRSCYTLVDPAPFLNMCGNDSAARHEHPGSVCHVAAMYVHACAKDGVHLRMPRHCVRCDDTMEVGEVAGLADVTSAVRSADVVFVVEESECNQDMLTHVRNIAIKMETMALRSIGLKNNQFGIVGFGGADVHTGPHSHTINGSLMGSARGLRRALPSMSFTATETSSDVSSALQLAATYPWRAGTSKSLILVTCDVSSSNGEAQRMLQELGVTVHVLRTHEFDVDSDTPRTSRLFGTDANTAFTSDHVSDEELIGDPELFQQIVSPSDSLTQLAHSSGGTLFDVSHLNSGRVAVQKRFIDVFVRRVAKSASPPSCQACTCEARDLTATQTVCRPCTRA